VNYLTRLNREITVMKYDVRQALALLDILVKRCEEEKRA